MAWVSPRTWVAGVTHGTAAIMNEIRDSLNAVGDGPPTYSPSVLGGWTSNFTISGWARNTGKWWEGAVKVTFTGLPAGSGTATVSLPATPSTAYFAGSPLGSFSIRDSSAAVQTTGQTLYIGGATIGGQYSATTRLQNATPYTLASGDTAWFQFGFWTD